jgi:hypothetical protein
MVSSTGHAISFARSAQAAASCLKTRSARIAGQPAGRCSAGSRGLVRTSCSHSACSSSWRARSSGGPLRGRGEAHRSRNAWYLAAMPGMSNALRMSSPSLVGSPGRPTRTLRYRSRPSPSTRAGTSTSDGEIHIPLCNGPKPAQTSRERSRWRWLRQFSGSEKPSMVQVPSQSLLTAPARQIRCWPSLSTASQRGVSPKYIRRPRRCRRSRSRWTIRVRVDLVACCDTPARPNTSMTLPEKTAVPRPST